MLIYMLMTEDSMRTNLLREAQPYALEQALRKVGANLRTARLRRRITIEEAAAKIGTGPRLVADAERGKPNIDIAVYAALLWLYDLLGPFEDLANPLKDEQGLILASRRERARTPRPRTEQ
jgi:transcriptional regulator with XRE-family HTH domain